jgi:hypothetical protein
MIVLIIIIKQDPSVSVTFEFDEEKTLLATLCFSDRKVASVWKRAAAARLRKSYGDLCVVQWRTSLLMHYILIWKHVICSLMLVPLLAAIIILLHLYRLFAAIPHVIYRDIVSLSKRKWKVVDLLLKYSLLTGDWPTRSVVEVKFRHDLEVILKRLLCVHHLMDESSVVTQLKSCSNWFRPFVHFEVRVHSSTCCYYYYSTSMEFL